MREKHKQKSPDWTFTVDLSCPLCRKCNCSIFFRNNSRTFHPCWIKGLHKVHSWPWKQRWAKQSHQGSTISWQLGQTPKEAGEELLNVVRLFCQERLSCFAVNTVPPLSGCGIRFWKWRMSEFFLVYSRSGLGVSVSLSSVCKWQRMSLQWLKVMGSPLTVCARGNENNGCALTSQYITQWHVGLLYRTVHLLACS